MKRTAILLLTLFLMNMCCTHVSAYLPPFIDIGSNSSINVPIQILHDLGVIKGHEDAAARPDDVITKAELFVLVCRLFSFEVQENSDGPFGSAQAAALLSRGILTEDPTGRLHEPATAQDTLETLLAALQYDGIREHGNYIATAEEIGLVNKQTVDLHHYMLRKDVFALCYEALTIPFANAETTILMQRGLTLYQCEVSHVRYQAETGEYAAALQLGSVWNQSTKRWDKLAGESLSVLTGNSRIEQYNSSLALVLVRRTQEGTAVLEAISEPEQIQKEPNIFRKGMLISDWRFITEDLVSADFSDEYGELQRILLNPSKIRLYINDFVMEDTPSAVLDPQFIKSIPLQTLQTLFQSQLEPKKFTVTFLADDLSGCSNQAYVTIHESYVIQSIDPQLRKIVTTTGDEIILGTDYADLPSLLLDGNPATLENLKPGQVIDVCRGKTNGAVLQTGRMTILPNHVLHGKTIEKIDQAQNQLTIDGSTYQYGSLENIFVGASGTFYLDVFHEIFAWEPAANH